jgi:hypothetical protein
MLHPRMRSEIALRVRQCVCSSLLLLVTSLKPSSPGPGRVRIWISFLVDRNRPETRRRRPTARLSWQDQNSETLAR